MTDPDWPDGPRDDAGYGAASLPDDPPPATNGSGTSGRRRRQRRRVFARELSADPLGWLGAQLADLDAILATGGFPADTARPGDAESLRRTAPEIVDATRRLLDKVRLGELGNPPPGASPAASGAGAGGPAPVRAGWL